MIALIGPPSTIFCRLLLCLACVTTPLRAAEAQSLITGPKIPISTAKTGSLAKVEPLAGVFLEFQQFKDQGGVQARGPFQPSDPSLPTPDSEVCIDAIATGDPDLLLIDLEALGLRNGESFGRLVGGCLPIDSIDEAATLGSLRFARPAAATSNVGAVSSQGDKAMRADLTRSTRGTDGSGVVVGTLSDSFDCLGAAAADVASGDLPAGINVLDDSACPGSDEGRAMMQLIADVAPGASQSFHTAFVSQASFAQGIVDLHNTGADVIVDDVIYFSEPMFQDGIIAQAVDQVKAAGKAYFSSAGNAGRKSYEANFRPSGFFETEIGGELHDFNPGAGVDTFQRVTLPAGTTIFSFQWNDVYASAGPGGSSSDYDIWICTSPTSVSVVNCPVRGTSNNISGDPIEIATANVTGGPSTVHIALSRYQGAGNRKIKYVAFSPPGFAIKEYNTQSSTIYGHANAAGAIAVGAAFYQNTPEFGVSPPVLESYSSAGGTAILRDAAGNSIAATVRPKPDIVAPDGVNNTFFPEDAPPSPDPENDGFPNFFGTSAAAPHAAAIAALLLDCDGTLSPDTVYDALKQNTIDIGPPGFDSDSGHGLIDGFMAADGPCAGGTGSIGDFVWEDTDEDGIQGPGEPGRANVTVNLQNCTGAVLRTTVTDDSGRYLFDNLSVGTYVIEFVAPAGFALSAPLQGTKRGQDSNPDPATGLTSCMSIGNGQARLGIDAGLINQSPPGGSGSIGDFVWEDTDEDGIQDPGEPGHANVTVRLQNCTGTVLQTTVTDGSGRYLFENLAVDSYMVEFVPPQGFVLSPALRGIKRGRDSNPDTNTGLTNCMSIGNGQARLGIDAGLINQTAASGSGKIGDFVWLDEDQDGIQDSSESGRTNVMVYLHDCHGNVIQTTVTGGNGKYLFDDLAVGSYVLEFVPPAGFQLSPRFQGNKPGRDSDPHPATGMTNCLSISQSQTRLGIDAGLMQ